uniref:G-protein coupled receptors family 1 profile domain-containing protein n=1 Tax=Leptobrachium leishanense TaxID=445787 RepID=A0A8C5ML83_9ANUR
MHRMINHHTVDSEMLFSEGVAILIIVLITFLIFLTVSGNILVMLAFIVDKRLRTQSNFFLLNLAICDFYIGAFSTPLYLPYLINGKWMLGSIVCKLWLTIDYTMCAASVFNIVLISYDRFLSVTKAVLYRSQQNRHSQTVLKMMAVWVLSFLLYGPAILFGDLLFGVKYISDSVCVAEFFDIWHFNLVSSVFDFALPLISISFFNLSIYWNIKKRRRNKVSFTSHPLKEMQKSPYVITTDVAVSNLPLQQNEDVSVPVKKIKRHLKHYLQTSKRSTSNNSRNTTYNVQVIQLSRDVKVAKSLLILVSVFAVCWAPYTFVITIGKVCNSSCIEPYWYEITVWLLYMNSAINPILYPLCHKSFRNSFNLMFKMCLKKWLRNND